MAIRRKAERVGQSGNDKIIIIIILSEVNNKRERCLKVRGNQSSVRKVARQRRELERSWGK